MEEKLKNNPNGKAGDDDEESSSDDETEDEEGFLATEDLDAQISATLQAIRNKDPMVYDKDVTFYKPTETETETGTSETKDKKDKPVYLRDYHREKLLRGDVGASDDEDDDAPKTYNQEQDDLKNSILNEINAVAAESDDDDEDDDGFMKRKEPAKPDANGIHPSRKPAVKVTELDVENADKNPENFLSNFLSARAWIPADGSNWKAFESDEGESDDQADQFEQAYNLRFEDPEKSNEFLKSYARDIAAAKSVRREEMKGRKRQRELEKERKEAEKKERQEDKARLRKLKLEEAEKRLKKIKQAAGKTGKELTDEEWIKFLDEAWEDDKWEEEMQKRFGDEYYAQEDEDALASDDDEEAKKKSKKPKKPKELKKPKWDDDIDIKDIIPDFEDDEEKPQISLSDVEEEQQEQEDEDEPPSKKRKTSEHKRARQEAQKQARAERSKLEALVDHKLELNDHELLRSKPASGVAPFRYRETSPQSFGLTARDILLAPSDQALNQFAGLKKLAPFRAEERKRRDRKKFGRKARLRSWRRDMFGPEFERTGPTYGFERAVAAADAHADAGADWDEHKFHGGKDKKGKQKEAGAGAEGGIADNNVVGDVGERKKKRKRSKGKKGTAERVE